MLILDPQECQSSGSVVMRNAKNPNCLDLAKVPEEAEDKCERAREMEGNRGEVAGRELCDHRGENMREKKIYLEKILYMLWSDHGEEKLLKLTWHTVYVCRLGVGHGSACPKKST